LDASPGGLMRWAIPEFRLPMQILNREMKFLSQMGVRFEANRTLGKDLDLKRLESEFDAVVLALGAYGRVPLDMPGEDHPAILPSLSFMKRVRENHPPSLGERVIVIGGGNAAVDAAQTALRLGVQKVQLVSLEKKEEMPAFSWSVTEAEEEGVYLQNGWGPALFRADRFNGTYISTCAAIGTEFRINYINITFSDCLHRAFVNTGTACSTVISYFISHC